MIVVNNLQDFQVRQTYCWGRLVAERGQALLPTVPVEPLNRFAATERRVEDFQLPVRSATVRTIVAIDGQLVTLEGHVPAPTRNGLLTADVSRDILKLAVINRYAEAPPAPAGHSRPQAERQGIIQWPELALCLVGGVVRQDDRHLALLGFNRDEIGQDKEPTAGVGRGDACQGRRAAHRRWNIRA